MRFILLAPRPFTERKLLILLNHGKKQSYSICHSSVILFRYSQVDALLYSSKICVHAVKHVLWLIVSHYQLRSSSLSQNKILHTNLLIKHEQYILSLMRCQPNGEGKMSFQAVVHHS